MENKVKFINHCDITDNILDQIIDVKNAAWPYDYSSHFNWIKKNLKNTDIHVLLLNESDSAIAYLNLIQIQFVLDGRKEFGLGIGNVCALEKGKGWGKEILSFVNEYIKLNDTKGVLFCKPALVKFYISNGWKVIPAISLNFEHPFDNKNYCLFYPNLNFEKFIYDGKLF